MMEIIESAKEKTTIGFSSDELIILNNALNEICNGIAISEFETRIGYSLEKVKEMLNKLQEIIADVSGKRN